MHISRIKLWNFRKFGSEDDFDLEKPNLDLPLSKGTNVLVGENDSGKTAIIDAIRFAIGTHSVDWNRITLEDFYNGTERLRIEVYFDGLTEDEGKNFIEWLSWHKDNGENVTVSRQKIWDKIARKLRETFMYYSLVSLIHTVS